MHNLHVIKTTVKLPYVHCKEYFFANYDLFFFLFPVLFSKPMDEPLTQLCSSYSHTYSTNFLGLVALCIFTVDQQPLGAHILRSISVFDHRKI